MCVCVCVCVRTHARACILGFVYFHPFSVLSAMLRDDKKCTDHEPLKSLKQVAHGQEILLAEAFLCAFPT